MTYIFLTSIRWYRRFFSPLFNIGFLGCRFYPSCSEYTERVIERYGILKGVILAIWRLGRCQPFSHGGVDLP